MADVLHVQFHQIAGAQFAIKTKIKECKLASAVFELQPTADSPNFADLEGCLLTY